MSHTPSRLPNLYQLLGLDPLESDRQRIVSALKKVQARLKLLRDSGQDSKSDEQARVQKLLALGQQLLLDPARKQQYDVDWQSVFGTPAIAPSMTSNREAKVTAASTTGPAQWSLGSLEVLLPEGDPHAAFDLAAYLRSSEVRDPAAAEADLNKLISLLGGEPLPTATSTTGSLMLTDNQLSAAAAYPQSSSDEPTATGISLVPSSGSPKAVATLAQRMRKRQQRTLMFGSLGLIAGVLALAGLFVFLNRPKTRSEPVAQAPVKQPPKTSPATASPIASTQDTASHTAQPGVMHADNSASPAPAQQNPPAGTTPSGLIQPGQLAKPLEIQASSAPAMQPEANNAAGAPMNADAPAMTPTDAPAPTSDQAASMPAMQPENPAQGEPASSPSTEDMQDQPLSDNDKRDWQRNMKSISVSLGKLQVTDAQKRLTELQAEIKTSKQRQQHARLTTIAALVADARQCIVDAILNLEPAQVLTIKNAEVSFIAGDENQIVVKQNGQRRQFKLEELTAALAEVLIDQNKLDARLLAAKGAYLMLHPKNSVVAERAKQMLQDAAHDGVISPELATFYEDDYSLDR